VLSKVLHSYQTAGSRDQAVRPSAGSVLVRYRSATEKKREGSSGRCDDSPGGRYTDRDARQDETVRQIYNDALAVRAAYKIMRRRNRSGGELPSCGNAQSANAVWSGMVSGLQSEYARARNTADTKRTYDAWQLHEESHKEGGE